MSCETPIIIFILFMISCPLYYIFNNAVQNHNRSKMSKIYCYIIGFVFGMISGTTIMYIVITVMSVISGTAYTKLSPLQLLLLCLLLGVIMSTVQWYVPAIIELSILDNITDMKSREIVHKSITSLNTVLMIVAAIIDAIILSTTTYLINNYGLGGL